MRAVDTVLAGLLPAIAFVKLRADSNVLPRVVPIVIGTAYRRRPRRRWHRSIEALR